MHHLCSTVAADFLPVILEVMRIAGHRDSDVVISQHTIERSEIFRQLGDIMAFGGRGKIPAAGKARMAHDGHGEFAAAAVERALDPCPLSFVDRTQNAGVDRQQREIAGLQFEKRSPLGTSVDAILPTQARCLRHQLVDAASISTGKS